MTIDFPASGLDNFTNPANTDKLNNPSHSTQHANINDALEALEAKVGVNSSAVTTSHDYKLGEVTGTDKAVGKTATQTLTNKTLTSPTLNTPTLTVLDSALTIQDNSDPTKQAQLQLSSITAGQTRTYTLPDRTDTLVDLGSTQTLTSKTLTTPTIADFTNAQHDHGDADDGGALATNTVATTNIVDDAVTAAKVDWASTGTNAGIWWEELGRTTLGSAGDTISVTSLPARKYLRLLISVQGTGGTVGAQLRFNNDSGANYADRITGVNNGADTTSTSQTGAVMTGSTTYTHLVYTCDIVNITAVEKVGTGIRTASTTSGAGTAPDGNRYSFKWVNTSAQITRVDVINGGTGDYAIGSEVVVLGHN